MRPLTASASRVPCISAWGRSGVAPDGGLGERSKERVNSRNGFRHRDFDTRVGTIDLSIPKLRTGAYFPDWLLEHRERAVVESLGVKALSKSQGSITAAHRRVVNVHCVVGTGVNGEGYREILGVQVTSDDDGAGQLAFFRDLVARGVSGVPQAWAIQWQSDASVLLRDGRALPSGRLRARL